MYQLLEKIGLFFRFWKKVEVLPVNWGKSYKGKRRWSGNKNRNNRENEKNRCWNCSSTAQVKPRGSKNFLENPASCYPRGRNSGAASIEFRLKPFSCGHHAPRGTAVTWCMSSYTPRPTNRPSTLLDSTRRVLRYSVVPFRSGEVCLYLAR